MFRLTAPVAHTHSIPAQTLCSLQADRLTNPFETIPRNGQIRHRLRRMAARRKKTKVEKLILLPLGKESEFASSRSIETRQHDRRGSAK